MSRYREAILEIVLCALRFVGGGEMEESWSAAGRLPVDDERFDTGILDIKSTQVTRVSICDCQKSHSVAPRLVKEVEVDARVEARWSLTNG